MQSILFVVYGLILMVFCGCYASKTTYKEQFELHLKKGDRLMMVDDRQDYADIYASFSDHLADHSVSFQEHSIGGLEYEYLSCRDVINEPDSACLAEIATKSDVDYLVINRLRHFKERESAYEHLTEREAADPQTVIKSNESLISTAIIRFEVWDPETARRMIHFDVETKSNGISFDETTVNVSDPDVTLIKARKKGLKKLRKLFEFEH